MKAYPVKSLYEEMAFIAHHFHWSHDELMRLEHRERRRWCREISSMNRTLDGAASSERAPVGALGNPFLV